MNYTLKLKYQTKNGDIITTDKSNDNVEIIADTNTMRVSVIPHSEISNIKFSIAFSHEFSNNTLIYCEGFQSWSYSREYSVDEHYEDTPALFAPLQDKIGALEVGNYKFTPSARRKGLFKSSTFFYTRESGNNVVNFIGSRSDALGYTTFLIDSKSNTITALKDFEGLTLNSETELINLVELQGDYDEIFDNYFKLLDIKKPNAVKLKGYSSWYNHYRGINEDIILNDLNAITSADSKINAFQIDDGYQPFIGDLTAIDETKFPNGIKPLIDAIHNKGLYAGIWACPFGVTKQSKTFKEHSDWLLKDEKGKPYKVGVAWGGFYALDIYNPDARDYIKNGLTEIVNWGVDFLKLDFLYAEASRPRNGKTRATIMREAMLFLRECVGDKWIIGCGAPMTPSYGLFEYMRIGADCTFHWRKFYDNISREMLSTHKTLLNTIYRRFYNERVFLNDPDVFYLRDDNIKMNVMQKELHAIICKLFGNVIFTSDNLNSYSDKAKDFYKLMMSDDNYTLISVNQIAKNVIEIKYSVDNTVKLLVFNYKNGDIYRMQDIVKSNNQ